MLAVVLLEFVTNKNQEITRIKQKWRKIIYKNKEIYLTNILTDCYNYLQNFTF